MNTSSINDLLIRTLKNPTLINTERTLKLFGDVYSMNSALEENDQELKSLVLSLTQFQEHNKLLPGVKLMFYRCLCLTIDGLQTVLTSLMKLQDMQTPEELKITQYIVNEHINSSEKYIKKTIYFLYDNIKKEDPIPRTAISLTIFILKYLKATPGDEYDDLIIKLIEKAMKTKAMSIKHKIIALLESNLAIINKKSRILDFVKNVFNSKEDILGIILSLRMVYALVTKHNFDFENLYEIVYELISNSKAMNNKQYNVEIVKFTSLILDSNYVSTSMIKAFIKKLANAAIHSNISNNKDELSYTIIVAIYNLLKNNTKHLQDMVISKDHQIDLKAILENEKNLINTALHQAIELSGNIKLWELKMLPSTTLNNSKTLDIINKILQLNFKEEYGYVPGSITLPTELKLENNKDKTINDIDWTQEYFR